MEQVYHIEKHIEKKVRPYRDDSVKHIFSPEPNPSGIFCSEESLYKLL